MFDELKRQQDLELELKEQGLEPAKAEKKEPQFNTTEVLSREQLLEILKREADKMKKDAGNRLHVGTVGYPNVGKSSLINVLCGRKRVGVAAMPGKTKHF